MDIHGSQFREHDCTAGKETVVISGDKPAAVEAAIAKVKQLIDAAKSTGPQAPKPAFTRVLQLPVGSESQVIGSGGLTVKAICQVRAARPSVNGG